MKPLFFLTTCVVLFFVTFPAGIVAGELRVLTFNIHIGVGMDGKRDLERIARTISEQKPDLVALQEVDRRTVRSQKVDQAEELSKLTGMKVVYGKTIPLQGGEYGVAVLSKRPILEHHMELLPQEKNEERRGVLCATIPLDEKRSFRFICTHLSYETKSGRLAQAKKINELFASDAMPGVLAGDMNAMPDDDAIKAFRDGGWMQVCDDKPTFPSPEPKDKIDYIFYRNGNDVSLRRIHGEVVPDAVGSDHRPVLGVLEWGQ